jgi:hypothetical protein
MYGVPADLDLTALYGGRLDQLCLGPFDIQFRFSTGHRISVWGSWQLMDASGALLDGSVGAVGDKPGNQSRSSWRIRDLLSDTVDAVEVEPPRSLRLRFASGRTLILSDDSTDHESFSIHPGDVYV